jgi:hypothetical protein
MSGERRGWLCDDERADCWHVQHLLAVVVLRS